MGSDTIYRFDSKRSTCCQNDGRFPHQVIKMQSKTSRAGCQNSACKNAEVKIQKGELRMGTLVWIRDNQTWMWKHWGCVTPVQIKNIQDMVEGLDLDTDLDVLDGWEDLLEESQDKIRQAIRDGHVADEDWKGEPELNRPGQKGINKRTPKKKAAEDEGDAEDELANSPTKPVKPVPKKTNNKSGIPEYPPDTDEEPRTKTKKKAASKKRKADEELSDDADDEPAPQKKAKTKSKSKVEADLSDGVDDEPPPKKKAQTRVKSTKATKKEPDIDDDVPAPASRAKRNSRTKKQPDPTLPTQVDGAADMDVKSKRGGKIKKEELVDSIENDPPAGKRIKKEVKTNARSDDEDDVAALEPAPVPAKPVKKGKKGKAKLEPGVQNEDAVEPEPEETKKPAAAAAKGRGRKAKKEEE